jgi:hypothetical protein
VLVPEEGGELVLDSHPGSEVLYLIVSRNELSSADPHLATVLGGTGEGSGVVDCGMSLDSRLMKSTGVLPASNVLRGEPIPKSSTGADDASSPATGIAADADGIAIVRYRFSHVGRDHD